MFADLHVVTAISNPERYRSRYSLFKNFEKHVLDSGAKLYVVEAAFGERPHAITTANNPNHIQLRTSSEIWHKENMLNIGISRLPSDWKYVAWIDADITFARPDWVDETIHQLQHFHIVQMFSHAMDLAPDYAPTPDFYGTFAKPASWAYCYVHNLPRANTDLKKELLTGKMIFEKQLAGDGYSFSTGGFYFHPGYCWAARREAFDALGGLIDFSILGAADYLMAGCLTGLLSLPDSTAPSYNRWIQEWKMRADRYIRGNIGYVPGTVMHNWHGRKKQRGYRDRWKIFSDHKFDPELDLKKDWQGLYQLTDRTPGLRDDIRLFMRSRCEDSIDL